MFAGKRIWQAFNRTNGRHEFVYGYGSVPGPPVQERAACGSRLNRVHAVAGSWQPLWSLLRIGNVNVLLVEDHRETRETLVLLLARCGHSATTAKTVSEALQLLEQTRVHVLLCDLGLPDGDGLEVVAGAKKLNPDIKAIALTARDTDDDYKVGFDAGFDHYLTKPFDFGELRTVLAR